MDTENAQVAKLIVALGDSDSGKMAILKAIAERHGVVDDESLRKLASGEAPDSDRLHVPGHLRVAMCEIGLHCAMAPINVMETLETQAILMANEDWNDLEFEVALESGAVIHVCSPTDCPGYVLEESPVSKRGHAFLLVDAGTIPNPGQKSPNLSDTEVTDLRSIFSISALTPPLTPAVRRSDQAL